MNSIYIVGNGNQHFKKWIHWSGFSLSRPFLPVCKYQLTDKSTNLGQKGFNCNLIIPKWIATHTQAKTRIFEITKNLENFSSERVEMWRIKSKGRQDTQMLQKMHYYVEYANEIAFYFVWHSPWTYARVRSCNIKTLYFDSSFWILQTGRWQFSFFVFNWIRFLWFNIDLANFLVSIIIIVCNQKKTAESVYFQIELWKETFI